MYRPVLSRAEWLIYVIYLSIPMDEKMNVIEFAISDNKSHTNNQFFLQQRKLFVGKNKKIR